LISVIIIAKEQLIKGVFNVFNKRKYYRTYSDYLKEKYGEKVYKLPVCLPVTCPNRDGTLGVGGCIYCGEEGGVFGNQSPEYTIKQQINRLRPHIKERYNARKFIVYFQTFTNTYIPLEEFKKYVFEALEDDEIVELSISTRPDCISEEYLDFLDQVKLETKKNVTIELGLQTVNYHTLKKLNRGHSLAEFIDAVSRIKQRDFEICSHVILNLPWDSMIDVVENSKIISALKIDTVKLHSLYVVKGTPLAEMLEKGEIHLISREEYIERVITFLEHLDPEIAVQRLVSRAPEQPTLFVNWNTSWWRIRDKIENLMEKRGSFQGKRFDYLNGKALKGIKNSKKEYPDTQT